MADQWTPSSAVDLWHPEDAIDLSTPEDTSLLGRIKKKASDIISSPQARRILDTSYRSPEELEEYKRTHNGQSPEPVIGQPSDESILPELKHAPDEGWLPWLAKGAYNQV